MRLFMASRRGLSECGLFPGFTDWHCHLLPGVDDGVRTMEDSLAILSDYESLGVREAWLTPHIMENVPNGTSALRKRFNELKTAYYGATDAVSVEAAVAAGRIPLHLAAENMLDSLFGERLAAGDLLPIGTDGNMLLVETSTFGPPIRMENILQGIKAAGYHPLLAHPERYIYMEMRDYRKMRDLGVLLQLNIFSLVGLYGSGAQKKAETLLEAGMYFCAGTDLHRRKVLESCIRQKSLKPKTVERLSQLHGLS